MTSTNWQKQKYNLRHFFRPIWQNKKFFILWAVDPILWWLHPPVVVYIFKHITEWIETWNMILVNAWLKYLIIFIVLSYCLRRLFKWFFRNWPFVGMKSIHSKYLTKFLNLNNNYTDKIWTWKFVTAVNKWMDIWSSGSAHSWSFWISYFLWILWSLYLIFDVSVWLGLWTIVFFIISWFLTRYLDIFALYRRWQRRDFEHAHTESMIRVVMSKFEVLQSNRISNEIEKLDDYMDRAMEKNLRVSNFIDLIFIIQHWSVDILRILLVIVVWYWVVNWVNSFSNFVAIVWATYVLESVITRAVKFYKDLSKNLTYYEKMINLFEDAPLSRDFESWESFAYQAWAFELRDLTYAYDKNTVFDQLSFVIQWWKKTALVWVSWSGKSTLVKLIAWYLSPDSWSIIVDGQNLSEVSLKTYYKHIWYLTQEPSVFDGTIIDNLTYAIQWDVSKEKLDECIRLANCEFILDFPKWIHTEIWERGIRLSGWQRQRLAIAKIFLKDPEIIILDEPTSALDSFSEEAITEAMKNLFEWRTVIIIAHRLQTVKNADDIFVLDEWKVVERGTHQELVDLWSSYAKMLELQSGF